MVADSEQRRHELAAFLRARRAALAPGPAGLHPGLGRRRVPGLRREEVANLAGVSYSWYTRLEQGQGVRATAEVIDSIGAALQLTDDEHRHLRRLAALPLGSHEIQDDSIDEQTRRFLERLLPAPAYVLGPRSDYLAWNDALSAVFCDVATLPTDRRNVLWATFTAREVRTALVDWDEHARRVVGQFRAEAAAHPTDSRFSTLASELSGVSAEFRSWWSGHEVVRAAGGSQTFRHSEVGLLNTHLMQLRFLDRPSMKLIVHQPATDSDIRKLERIQGAHHWSAVIGD